MYILNWNPGESRIEASFGGVLTKNEAICFVDEFRDMLMELGERPFEVVIDYAMVPRMEEGVIDALTEAREISTFAGSACVTFVTRTEDEAHAWVDIRLADVLDGRENYVAYRMAS